MDDIATLSPEHHHELRWDSCIDDAVLEARGYRTLYGTASDRQELEDLGYKRAVWNRDDAFPGLLIPMHGADGTIRSHQFKPAVPRTRIKEDGAPLPIKYESIPGKPSVVDVPAFTRSVMQEPGRSLWITEGMKKTDSLVSVGMAALGLTGVWNWRSSHAALGDWEDIPIKGHPIVLCFDADAAGNRHVQLAMARLGAWLRTKGATTVHYLTVPGKVGETEVKGVDDYFAAGGTLADLKEAASPTPPGAGEKGAAFTDAFLVEDLAEAMEGRFCWAAGLGWLRWNGQIWKEVSDVEPLEAVRLWASEQYDKVLTEQSKDKTKPMTGQISGWRAILNKGRLTGLRDLSKGLLQRNAADFDGDPDLLTVANGTLHLPSGKLLPFDPEHCITKQAGAEYRRGLTHPAWTAILRAIPGDMHEWYQDRLGQAMTGYPVPDHTLVIAHGTGQNGKSALASVVRRTVGTYGVMISDRVLMANPDAHPTELMDLRGARYALMEETPEARHLNVQRLKTVLGTETIRARHIRQDSVEFLTSHSLFINTNYRPVVTETDWGTWRRLSLMPFPFTFKKPGSPLSGPTERTGDPTLAYASNDPEIRSAALAWMAEGAREWYARGRMMLDHPARVEKETREWRAETDLILGFSDECLRFTPEAFTQTRDMLTAFNEWAGERGHRPWNDRTFATRFGDHDTVRGAKVQQGRFSIKGKQMRGWSGVEINKDGQDPFTGERDVPSAPGVFDHYVPPEFGGPDLDTPPEERPAPEETFHTVQGTDPVQARFIEPTGSTCPNCNGTGCAFCDIDRPRQPVVLGFDLETASASELFTGRHEGPFIRLAGDINADGVHIGKLKYLLDGLNDADTIYAHAGLSYDNIALARHCGVDYDALSAKTWDTLVAEVLVDPPLSKGMPSGYYKLNTLAARYGVKGKTDDINALAKKHGGHDKIPLDDPDYNAYLRGDLTCLKAVYEKQFERVKEMGLEEYAAREMRVVALQNRMTLNGWKVDVDLLNERVAQEEAKRQEAIRELHERYGVPTHAPDRFKLLPKAQWPEGMRALSTVEARAVMAEQPDKAISFGTAVRIPGERHASPWATTEGKAALVKAFEAAGAPHVPRSVKTGDILTSADALGEVEWWDKNRRRMVKGMLHPDCYGSNDAVRAICEVMAHATGARVKYAEIARYVTPEGRVHPGVGQAQGSGRWGSTQPSTTNMGKRGAAGEERAVMVADDGHVLITVDASQVDMRAVAALSQDKAYMEIFQPGRDAHMEMAEVYFGERTEEKRQRTKRINHKFNYGGGVESTAAMEQIDLRIVQQADDARQAAYPRLMEYFEEVRAAAERGELLDNGFGRLMRPDPERSHTQGPALMGQGAARDICTTSLLRLVELDPRSTQFMRGFVHDELIMSVPVEEAVYWTIAMQIAFTWEWRGVPILCEVSQPAHRWSECK